MTTKQHDAILKGGAKAYGITESEYRETIEYAVLVRELLRPHKEATA